MQKLMIMLFPLVFLSGDAQNQPTQVDTQRPSVLQELKADSKELKAATEELKNVPIEQPKPTVIYKTKKVYVPCRYATVKFEGDTITVKLQQHDGAPFFDLDKMRDQSSQASVEDAPVDTLSEALLDHANDEIGKWYQFRRNIKHFFNGKK